MTCWFCDKPLSAGYYCLEFDCEYHEECGNKVLAKPNTFSSNTCAVCVSEGCQYGNHDGFEPCCKDEEIVI